MADGLQQLGIPATPERTDDFGGAEPTPVLTSRASLSDAAERIRPRNRTINRPIMREALKLADIAIAAIVSFLFLNAGGYSLLQSSVAAVLPFVFIPVVMSWGLRRADAYNLSFARPVSQMLLRSSIGSGLALAGLVVGLLQRRVAQRLEGFGDDLEGRLRVARLVAVGVHLLRTGGRQGG